MRRSLTAFCSSFWSSQLPVRLIALSIYNRLENGMNGIVAHSMEMFCVQFVTLLCSRNVCDSLTNFDRSHRNRMESFRSAICLVCVEWICLTFKWPSAIRREYLETKPKHTQNGRIAEFQTEINKIKSRHKNPICTSRHIMSILLL